MHWFSQLFRVTLELSTLDVQYWREPLPCYAVPLPVIKHPETSGEQRQWQVAYRFVGSLAACEGSLPRFENSTLTGETNLAAVEAARAAAVAQRGTDDPNSDMTWLLPPLRNVHSHR
jgi:hypothetical protein